MTPLTRLGTGLTGEPRGAGVGGVLRFGRLVLLPRGGVLPTALQTVAVAVHLEDMHVVGETVQQHTGEPF